MHRFVQALTIAAVLAMPHAADAAQMRFFDPSSGSYVTYDPDAVRGGSGLRAKPAPRVTPRRQQVAIPQPPARVAPPPPVTHAPPDPKFDRQVVEYDTTEEAGTIVIDTKEKFLYYVMEDGQAIRMGVGVGREGFGWTGTVYVGSKQESPKWFPPPEMVQRQPELAKYAKNGMPGGEGNPLGVRALYLDDETGKDTLYRLHGTIEPWSIGQNVSSGCIRLLNENITELYDLAEIGTKVIVM
jgi:lipoprotein-anchoring transpeptidase ErfK/SrfK